MNIVILILLILTGCFGMFGNDEDDSKAQTTDVTATLTAQDIADAMILANFTSSKRETFDWSDETLGGMAFQRVIGHTLESLLA